MYKAKKQYPFPVPNGLNGFHSNAKRKAPSHQQPSRLKMRLARFTRNKPLFRFLIFLLLACIMEIYHHTRQFRIATPSIPLDRPFQTHCVEPSPSSPHENAVIIMLASNKDVESAIKTVKSFESQFNRWYHYPMVFFNDEEWSGEFVEKVGREGSGNVSFETVGREEWGWPEWMGEGERGRARKSMERMEREGIHYSGMESYHHMCRFFAGKFYDHPALKPYKWYWRVDSDVEFTCAMPYDPFTAMSRSSKKYGYTMALWEVGTTAPSLFRTVDTYRDHLSQQKPSNLWLSLIEPSRAPLPLRKLLSGLTGRNEHGDIWNFCHFWSNFEIADLDFFRGREYREFFDMLDRSGGFYFERWGDAPVHSLGAALLLQPVEIHYFRDYGYLHDGLQRCPGNAKGGQLKMSTQLGDYDYDDEKEDGIGCRCKCDQKAKWLRPVCQNLVNRAVGGEREIFGN